MEEEKKAMENEVATLENAAKETADTPQETVTSGKKTGSKRIIAICAALAVLAVALVIAAEIMEHRAEQRVHQMQGQMLAQQAQNANVALISQEDATAIALNAAGIDAGDAKWLNAYLDTDHGFYQYEVSFVSGTYEYDFEIDATTGNIMESDVDSVFD